MVIPYAFSWPIKLTIPASWQITSYIPNILLETPTKSPSRSEELAVPINPNPIPGREEEKRGEETNTCPKTAVRKHLTSGSLNGKNVCLVVGEDRSLKWRYQWGHVPLDTCWILPGCIQLLVFADNRWCLGPYSAKALLSRTPCVSVFLNTPSFHPPAVQQLGWFFS